MTIPDTVTNCAEHRDSHASERLAIRHCGAKAAAEIVLSILEREGRAC